MKPFTLLILCSLLALPLLTQSDVSSADEEPPPLLELSVASYRCGLVLTHEDVAPESTPEPEVTSEPTPDDDGALDYPIITLGVDCDDVLPRLRVAANGTLWIALTAPDEDGWQQFEPLEDDDYPPQLDRRGRFIGCAHPQQGQQVCRVLWQQDDITYLVEIPFVVGATYVAPTPTGTPPAMPTTQPQQPEQREEAPLPTDAIDPPPVPLTTESPTSVQPTVEPSPQNPCEPWPECGEDGGDGGGPGGGGEEPRPGLG